MSKRGSAAAVKRIQEAIEVLRELGLPRQQLNERSALTLLSILDLKPDEPWADACAPLIGITPMMQFFAKYYSRRYAPNTRETVRRQTVHQFVQAGLVVSNPDEPSRPTNSPKAVYQIEPAALKLLHGLEHRDGLRSYPSTWRPWILSNAFTQGKERRQEFQ